MRLMRRIASWYSEWASTLDSAGRDSGPARARMQDSRPLNVFAKVAKDQIELGQDMDVLKRYTFYNQVPEWPDVMYRTGTIDTGLSTWDMYKRFNDHYVMMLFHAICGIQTEVSELMETFRAYIVDGKPINWVNIFEEFGDILWYIGIGCKAMGLKSILPLMRGNYKKLVARYGEEWEEKRARVRDKEKEQQLLRDEYNESRVAPIAQNVLYYLSSPYRTDDDLLREQRYEQTALTLTYLMNQGKHVFSPIIHNAPIKRIADLGSTWEDWLEYDLDMLSRCDAVMVCRIDGWKESIGVQAEIDHALKSNIPVVYCDPVTLEQVMEESRLRAIRRSNGDVVYDCKGEKIVGSI